MKTEFSIADGIIVGLKSDLRDRPAFFPIVGLKSDLRGNPVRFCHSIDWENQLGLQRTTQRALQCNHAGVFCYNGCV
jgi:hypothetical protein